MEQVVHTVGVDPDRSVLWRLVDPVSPLPRRFAENLLHTLACPSLVWTLDDDLPCALEQLDDAIWPIVDGFSYESLDVLLCEGSGVEAGGGNGGDRGLVGMVYAGGRARW